MLDHIHTLTDLLLGAAYADKRLDGRELEVIRELLETVVAESPLPPDLEERIAAFNPAKHDPHTAAASLAFLSEDDKHTVVDLIATVTEADDEVDMDEDAYLRRVAEGLGLSAEEIADLTVQIIDDEDLPGLLARGGDEPEPDEPDELEVDLEPVDEASS